MLKNSLPQSSSSFFKTLLLMVLAPFILYHQAVTAQDDSQNNAENTGDINFYLPFNATLEPQLPGNLSTVLQAQGLTNINIQSADYWQLYLSSVQRGNVGLYWVAPHFAAWLIHKHQFVPLLKLEPPLEYSVVTRKDDFVIFSLADLKGKQICSQHAMNLDFLLASELFEEMANPPSRAVTWDVAARFAADDTRCDAFVVSNTVLQRVASTRPEHWIKLHTSPPFTNYSLVAHPSFTKKTIDSFSRAMNSQAMRDAMSPIWFDHADDGSMNSAQKTDYPIGLIAPLTQTWEP